MVAKAEVDSKAYRPDLSASSLIPVCGPVGVPQTGLNRYADQRKFCAKKLHSKTQGMPETGKRCKPFQKSKECHLWFTLIDLKSRKS